ncbi:MAG TPA: hypothetical protein VFX98_08430, partial [Longimicrobiaceae bacterium]|nr:hypothetical protein [Longimicrobiaceae bacterium]
THDHFGPSTHQQTGLYAGLITEKKGSTWRDPETGVMFGTRAMDGGPTSWRADIIFNAFPDSSYREFNLQIADFALAYDAGATTFPNPALAINPAGKFEPNPILPFMLRPPVAGACPSGDPAPCPELVSADDPGTMLVNYRNEPLALRVRDPATNTQASGEPGDLSLAFASDVNRRDGRLNSQPTFYRPLVQDMRAGDPFTPLIRVYEDDKVQIRILVGAHEEGHNFSVHGTEWLFEPSDSASGYRNSQMMGISEHYEFVLPPLVDNADSKMKATDYLYQGGSATDDLWNGMWGIIRAYRQTRGDLLTLPSNPDAATAYAMAVEEQSTQPMDSYQAMSPSAEFMETSTEDSTAYEQSADAPVLGTDGGYGEATTTESTDPYTGTPTYTTEPMAAPTDESAYSSDPASATTQPEAAASSDQQTMAMAATDPSMEAEMAYAPRRSTSSNAFNGMCPRSAPVRQFDVTAVAAARALPAGRIVYNSRTVNGGPLYDPSGLLYVFTSDLTWNGSNYVLKSGVPIEPLVLRANAGDCIQVRLRNRLPNTLTDPDGYNTLPMIVDRFNANQVDPSTQVGLHPQLVAFDPARSDGSKVGFNPRTVVRPGHSRDYQWYAGEVTVQNGQLVSFPVEYGATNLIPSDRIKHANKGAVAAMIIEPVGATWKTDPASRAQATVFNSNGTKFREFVLLFQDDVNLRFGSTKKLAGGPTAADSVTFLAGSAVPNLADAEDAEDSGQKAFNYRTEPLWFRMGFAPNAPLEWTRTLNFRNSLKSSTAAPQTPTFTATAGDAVRFRVLQPGGHARNGVFNLHGHAWEEEPYNRNSRAIAANSLSEVKGAQHGHGPTNHFDVVPKNGAGGRNRIAGDYLYRNQASFTFDGGMWGIFRVSAPVTYEPPPPPPPPSCGLQKYCLEPAPYEPMEPTAQ